jgi:hypothetical protein
VLDLLETYLLNAGMVQDAGDVAPLVPSTPVALTPTPTLIPSGKVLVPRSYVAMATGKRGHLSQARLLQTHRPNDDSLQRQRALDRGQSLFGDLIS